MSTSYSLSIHPECIEGVQLTKRNERLSIKSEHSSAFIPMETGMREMEKIGNFLEAHKWSSQPISLIIPTEEVSFRTIHFPFQDKNKIQQTLPFEIQNEVLDEADESYQYTVQLLSDGTANVFLSLVPETYLEALIELANTYDLSIRNIDCAAHLLFKSVPPLKEDKPQFQIYLGAEETFINVVEDQYLQSVKIFSNRIPQYLREYPELHKIDPLKLQQMIIESPGRSKNSEVDERSIEYAISLLKEEIEWLCSQFNLFLKTWQLREAIHISQHGLFCTLINWNGKSFSLKTGNQDTMINSQEIGLDHKRVSDATENAVEDTMIDSQEIGLAEDDSDEDDEPDEIKGEVTGENKEESSWDIQEFSIDSQTETEKQTSRKFSRNASAAHLSDFSIHWGILGELKKYGLYHLEGHGLSFYSEGTPLKRFLRKHRLMTFMGILFLILSLGSFGTNYYLQLELLEREIELTELQLQTKLEQLLPEGTTQVDAAIAQLQNEVQQKKREQQETRFNMRTYKKLSFLQKISDLLPEKVPFIIRQLEYSQNRFSVKGAVDSYENLQILKSGLADFEEFKEKNIVETNSSNPQGIFFTISINR